MLAERNSLNLGPKGRQGDKADLLPLCHLLSWWEDMRHHLYNFLSQEIHSWAMGQVFQAASQPTQPGILAGAEVTFLLDTTMQESEKEF